MVGFQGTFKGVSRMIKVFKECLKCVSRKFNKILLCCCMALSATTQAEGGLVLLEVP